MPVPYTFANATTAIPLSQLDSNFGTAITLGNTAIQLGNTVTTLNNMTLANVTISSGTVSITNVAVTTANVSGTANISTLVVVGNTTAGGNVSVGGNVSISVNTSVSGNASVTGNISGAGGSFSSVTSSGSVTLSGGTANGVLYLNGSKVATSGTALTFDGSFYLGLTGAMKINSNGYKLRFYDATGATGYGYLYTDGTNLQFDSGNAQPLSFLINGSEQMRLTSTGLGIGTSSPGAKLDVAGTTTKLTNQTGADSTVQIGPDTPSAARSGRIGFITSSTQKNWYVANSWNVSGALEFTQTTATGGSTMASTPSMMLDGSGNFLVGTTSAGTGAIVDVQSTTKGVRFPNMTTTQKNAITPAAGTVIFDTTLAKLCVYSGSAWQTITSV